jgi:hypothetical protein
MKLLQGEKATLRFSIEKGTGSVVEISNVKYLPIPQCQIVVE